MTDQATAPAAIPALDAVAAEFVAAVSKPRRTWRQSKASFEDQIVELERAVEKACERSGRWMTNYAEVMKSRTRWAAWAFVGGCGFGGALVWLLG